MTIIIITIEHVLVGKMCANICDQFVYTPDLKLK